MLPEDFVGDHQTLPGGREPGVGGHLEQGLEDLFFRRAIIERYFDIEAKTVRPTERRERRNRPG